MFYFQKSRSVYPLLPVLYHNWVAAWWHRNITVCKYSFWQRYYLESIQELAPSSEFGLIFDTGHTDNNQVHSHETVLKTEVTIAGYKLSVLIV